MNCTDCKYELTGRIPKVTLCEKCTSRWKQIMDDAFKLKGNSK